MDDLIKTVEQVEERKSFLLLMTSWSSDNDNPVGQEDPHLTVQSFINLIHRHEQSFYHFVHKVHAKGDELFASLIKWIELFLTVVREGLREPINLEYLLPHTGKERAEIMAEVDSVALYHYKLKVLYEDKLRRRFGRANGQSQADVEDEATRVLVNGVVGEISFGELATGDAIDMAAEETDTEESSSEESFSSEESETESEDESAELNGSAHEGSSCANGRPMAHSPIPHSPIQPTSSQQDSNNSHQQSMPQLPRPSPLPVQPQPAVTRKKSFSLMKSKSLNFSLTNLSRSRRNDDVPPVPRSKTFYPPAQLSKPLLSNSVAQNKTPLPLPPKDSLVKERPPQISNPLPKTTSPRKKKPAQTLSPPKLEHIPTLLPVFAEIVSNQSIVYNTRYNLTNR